MKIAVIGAGAVGVDVCNYILLLGSVRELVLFDRNLDKAYAEMLDFKHTEALTFSKNTRLIPSDDYNDLKNSDIIVITAGTNIKANQDRFELAEDNSEICVSIAKRLEKVAPHAILIVVTNPCDLMAHFIIANTGYAPSQVMSTGCLIDTARLMSLVSDEVDLDPKNITGYVMGEHGTLCFVATSTLSVAGQPFDAYCTQHQLPLMDADSLLHQVRMAGFEIFNRKQNTNHGIAASVFRIIQAISVNERSVLPIGTLLRGEYGIQDVVLSVPCVIGKKGVESILDYPLTPAEKAQLQEIAHKMKDNTLRIAHKTGFTI